MFTNIQKVLIATLHFKQAFIYHIHTHTRESSLKFTSKANLPNEKLHLLKPFFALYKKHALTDEYKFAFNIYLILSMGAREKGIACTIQTIRIHTYDVPYILNR